MPTDSTAPANTIPRMGFLGLVKPITSRMGSQSLRGTLEPRMRQSLDVTAVAKIFMQIGQFLRVHQSIDLLNAHGAQGQADDYGQAALVPEQDGRAAIDLGQRQG